MHTYTYSGMWQRHFLLTLTLYCGSQEDSLSLPSLIVLSQIWWGAVYDSCETSQIYQQGYCHKSETISLTVNKHQHNHQPSPRIEKANLSTISPPHTHTHTHTHTPTHAHTHTHGSVTMWVMVALVPSASRSKRTGIIAWFTALDAGVW